MCDVSQGDGGHGPICHGSPSRLARAHSRGGSSQVPKSAETGHISTLKHCSSLFYVTFATVPSTTGDQTKEPRPDSSGEGLAAS